MSSLSKFLRSCLAAASLTSVGHAVSIYTVSIVTPPFHQSVSLAFDLIGGDAMFGNNQVTISDFSTDGTFSGLNPVSLTDTGFFNEQLISGTLGTYLNFKVTLTENNAAAGADEFSFFFLDRVTGRPYLTSDPSGASAMFAIDITGAPGGSVSSYFVSYSGFWWDVTPAVTATVPDEVPTVVLLLPLILGLGWVSGRRRMDNPTTRGSVAARRL